MASTTHERRDRAEKTVRARWEKLGFGELLPEEQRYIALFWLKCEIMNGGFHQYFTNDSGDLAPLALEGLNEIGAIESLRILEDALAVFPRGCYSTDREQREKNLMAISGGDIEAEIRAFDRVSDALQDYPEDFYGMALDRLAALYSSNGVWSSKLDGA
jgi:hypothetical protein